MPKTHNKVDTATLENIKQQNLKLILAKQRIRNKVEQKNGQSLSTINIQYYTNEPHTDNYYQKREQENQLTARK